MGNNDIYDECDLAEDYLEYAEWVALHESAKRAPVQLEMAPLGQVAKICAIPVCYGGPDPPMKPPEYDPRIHVEKPAAENPWELCCQLHCNDTLEEILKSRGENPYSYDMVAGALQKG